MAGPAPDLDRIATLAAASGLRVRGAFHPAAGDAVPDVASGAATATLVLLGNAGGSIWPAFSASDEHADGDPHPLDRWSRRIIDTLAVTLGATALYPFGGPPYHPFQRWALAAEPLARSPIGPLIHPRWGLWHAYRGALAFADRIELEPAAPVASPCASCDTRPCLATCPVGALEDGRYDVAACARHLSSAAGRECVERGCLARRACPVGVEYQYPQPQQALHMRAFLAARR